MKTITNIGAQGDVVFRRVDKLPVKAVKVARKRGQPLIVTHSETGHHHTVDAHDCTLFELPGDPLIAYLQLGAAECDVIHQRPWDTHETLRLLGGLGTTFEVRRQREWTPEGWRRVED